MSMNVSGSNKPHQGAKGAQSKKFEEEKAAAQSAAANNPQLLGRINAVTKQPGGIDQLESLMMQAIQSNSLTGAQAPRADRTIGMG